MTIKVLEDFRRRMIHDYSLMDVHIFHTENGKQTRLIGADVPATSLVEYGIFTSPKYIVREDGRELRGTNAVRSRFVWNTVVNGLPFLVVLDSGRSNAFDGWAEELVDEIQDLKKELEK